MKKCKILIVALLAALFVFHQAPSVAQASGNIEIDGQFDDWYDGETYEISKDLYERAALYETDDRYYIYLAGKETGTNRFGSSWMLNLCDGVSFSFTPKYNGTVLRNNYPVELNIPSGLKGNGMVTYTGNKMCYELSFEKDIIGKWIYDMVYEWILAGTGSDSEEGGDGYTDIYTGITIDASFADWNSITKYDANDSYGRLDKVAAVWDDDYIYLYVAEKKGYQYQMGFTWDTILYLETDNGSRFPLRPSAVNWSEPRELDFFAYTGDKCLGTLINLGYVWEASFPIDSFGIDVSECKLLVQNNTVIPNITDISGNHTGGSGEEPEIPETSIVIDAYFDDWRTINKTRLSWNDTLIHYGALHIEDGILYGYVQINDLARFQFPSYMELKINNHQVVKISILSEQYGYIYQNGANTGLRVVNVDTWEQIGDGAVYINDNHYPGDKLEFAINLNLLADAAGLTDDEAAGMAIRTVELYIPALGSQHVTVAGVSTGAILGIAVCSVFALAYFRKRKKAVT